MWVYDVCMYFRVYLYAYTYKRYIYIHVYVCVHHIFYICILRAYMWNICDIHMCICVYIYTYMRMISVCQWTGSGRIELLLLFLLCAQAPAVWVYICGISDVYTFIRAYTNICIHMISVCQWTVKCMYIYKYTWFQCVSELLYISIYIYIYTRIYMYIDITYIPRMHVILHMCTIYML